MRLSDDQRLAADPLYSAWLTANAGSGKTAVLVERVLRLLIMGARPGSILCLTYTVTAANEMLARIQQRMAQWSNMDDHALDAALENMDHSPSVALRQRARQLFLCVAEDREGLQIRTMHSFCQSLLSRFPFEAGIAPGSRPLEDEMVMALSRDLLVAMQHEALMQRAQDDMQPHWEYLLTYHFNRMDFKNFFDFYNRMRSEDITLDQLDLERNTALLLRDLGFEDLASLQDWPTACARVLAPIDWQELARHMEQQKLAKTDQATFDMVKACAEAAESTVCAEAMLSHCRTSKGGLRQKLLTQKLQQHDDIAQAIEMVQQAAEQLLWQQSVMKLVKFNQFFWPIVQEFHRRYEQHKRQHGLVDYHDQLHLVRRMLASDGGLNWVRYKLDSKIRYLFVDEAQDTSPVQWQILARLSEDFFTQQSNQSASVSLTLGFDAGGSTPEAAPNLPPLSLFVVGDPKQSIYRFQGADPKGFLREQEHYKHLSQYAPQYALQSRQLLRSYRSAPAILKVVDATFARDDPHWSTDATFADTQHIAHEDALPGYVEVAPYLAKGADGLAEHIATRIAGWLGQRRLSGTSRLVREGDIMILLPRRNRLFQQLHHALLRCGVATISGERSRLGHALPVQDILAVMRFLLTPDDDYMLACALKSSLIGLDEETLYRLATSRLDTNTQPPKYRYTLFKALRDAAKANAEGPLSQAWQWLEPLYQRIDFYNVNSLLAEILYYPCPRGESGFQAILGRFGVAARRAIERLEIQAVSFDQQSFSGVQGFVDAVMYRISQDNDRVEGTEAVRLMTIHAAKGLEAPIVLLPGANMITGSDEKSHVYQTEHALMALLSLGYAREELARYWQERACANVSEYRRLGYVAMTRAAQELYVYSDSAEPSKPPTQMSLYRRITQAIRTLPGAGEGSDTILYGDENIFSSPTYLVYKDDDNLNFKTQYKEFAEDKTDTNGTSNTHNTSDTDWLAPVIRPQRYQEAESVPLAPPTPLLTSAQKRGIVLHAILEGLCGLSATEGQQRLPQLVDLHARRWNLDAMPGMQQEIKKTIQNLLKIQKIQNFISISRAEIEVIEANASAGQQGHANTAVAGHVHRLDAVAREENYWQIVDFKSTQHRPEVVPAAYQQQLQRYQALWMRLYPQDTVRTAIIWVDQAIWQDIS